MRSRFKSVKILITGGCGFIGKHLIKAILRNKRDKLVVVDNLSNSNFQGFKEFVSPDGLDEDLLTFHEVDIQSREEVYRVFQKEIDVNSCIHLAARVNVIDSVRDPQQTFNINVKGTKNVLLSARRAGVQNFVFASSAAVYGNAKRLPIAEDDPTAPVSPYGKSKLMGEQLVQRSSVGFRFARSLRIFNVYGIGQTQEYAGVITRFAHRISNQLPLVIYGDGNQTRDFVSVHDVTRSIMMAAGLYDRKYDTNMSNLLLPNKGDLNYDLNVFNVGTGTATKISDLGSLMIQLISPPNLHLPEPIYEDRPQGEISNSQADTTKSRVILGFCSKDDLRSGLSKMFALKRS